MKRVQILLSAYNGEAYVREQLDSILRLRNADEVSVLIRDDGSTDATPAILAEYEQSHGFRVIYGENVGVNRSFQALFEAADDGCEYFAYCDQDDVWLPEKLTRAVTMLESVDPQTPALYATRSYLTDRSGTVIGTTRMPKRPPSFRNAMVQNVCIGHTQVYNRAMLALLRKSYSPDMSIIDHWAYLLASAFGTVLFDGEPTTLYRQHGKNVVGYGNTLGAVMRGRMHRVRTGAAVKMTRQNQALFDLYGDALPDARELSRFLSSQKNVFRRIGYALTTRARRDTFTENLCFRLLYVLGGYRADRAAKP